MKLIQKLSVLVVGFTLVMGMIIPGTAITYGELDEGGHPFVGLMVADDADGNPLWRCSGTLISPKIFLTAGHCTEAPAARATIWFEDDVDAGRPKNGYPFGGKGTGTVDGTTFTHPDYYNAPWFVHDLGIVVLDKAVKMKKYGSLPGLNVLDAMATQRGLQDITFTAVGYGLQAASPVPSHESFLRVRMVAYPHLIQINTPGFTGDFSILLSNNANTGGTCFGDSGGPNFIGDSYVVGGVTSYGLNGNCAGTGGVYRVDTADDLNWIATFFD